MRLSSTWPTRVGSARTARQRLARGRGRSIAGRDRAVALTCGGEERPARRGPRPRGAGRASRRARGRRGRRQGGRGGPSARRAPATHRGRAGRRRPRAPRRSRGPTRSGSAAHGRRRRSRSRRRCSVASRVAAISLNESASSPSSPAAVRHPLAVVAGGDAAARGGEVGHGLRDPGREEHRRDDGDTPRPPPGPSTSADPTALPNASRTSGSIIPMPLAHPRAAPIAHRALERTRRGEQDAAGDGEHGGRRPRRGWPRAGATGSGRSRAGSSVRGPQPVADTADASRRTAGSPGRRRACGAGSRRGPRARGRPRRSRPPDRVEQLLAGQDHARITPKRLQDPELERGEVDAALRRR